MCSGVNMCHKCTWRRQRVGDRKKYLKKHSQIFSCFMKVKSHKSKSSTNSKQK